MADEFRSAVAQKQSSTPVESAFSALLDKEINIKQGIREEAFSSQKHMRQFLREERKRDKSFPRILRNASKDFIGGSFARGTKIWPLDDVDLYFPLDGAGLIYHQYGMRLPYTVASDGVFTSNPLCENPDRWMVGSDVSSTKIISEFAAVLDRHYPDQTKVKESGEAVNVQMQKCSNESSDGLGFDVVPCFYLIPENTQGQTLFLIPDGNNSWIRTNPLLDGEISSLLHQSHNKTLRKVVKLLKYWNKVRFGDSLNSYYIELCIMKKYLSLGTDTTISTVPLGLLVAFTALRDAVTNGNGDITSWVQGAPSVESGYLSDLKRIALKAIPQKAAEAVIAESNGDMETALSAWSAIFGDTFDSE